MTILVTGATGQVGRHVVAQLAAADVPVRAMTRHPDDFASATGASVPAGVSVVRGDLLEPATLPVDGVTAMFLFPEPRSATAVVSRAVEAGVRRIVTLSSGAVTGGYDTDFQFPVEQAVEASGCEWTHLRPGEFASNTLRLWGPSIRPSGWCATTTRTGTACRSTRRTSRRSGWRPCCRPSTTGAPTT